MNYLSTAGTELSLGSSFKRSWLLLLFPLNVYLKNAQTTVIYMSMYFLKFLNISNIHLVMMCEWHKSKCQRCPHIMAL